MKHGPQETGKGYQEPSAVFGLEYMNFNNYCTCHKKGIEILDLNFTHKTVEVQRGVVPLVKQTERRGKGWIYDEVTDSKNEEEREEPNTTRALEVKGDLPGETFRASGRCRQARKKRSERHREMLERSSMTAFIAKKDEMQEERPLHYVRFPAQARARENERRSTVVTFPLKY